MVEYDFTEARAIEQYIRPDLDFDKAYTFYYDETNNIHKLRVREKGFNVDINSNFVLGGICYQGDKPDLATVFDGLGIQKTVPEVKLKYIATGDFEACVTSQELGVFLDRVLTSSVYLHYSSLNLLYWSIVDIVDSAMANSKKAMEAGLPFANLLKSNLYHVFSREHDAVVELFFKYQYPNLKKEEIPSFIDHLLDILEPYEMDATLAFGLGHLRDLLEKSKEKSSLVFVMDETDHELINKLTSFYLRPI